MKGGINLAGRQIAVIGNSRQMPSNRSTVREKDYCDLLYAWLQCHSEKLDSEKQRRIHKSLVKWTAIESDFTRTDKEGKIYKVMSRKTIAKYFGFLEEKELVELKDDYYYLTVLSPENANLIECKTLDKLMNVFQKNSLNIYNYFDIRLHHQCFLNNQNHNNLQHLIYVHYITDNYHQYFQKLFSI